MITPQYKAKELFNKYYHYKWMSYRGKKQLFNSLPKFSAKQCALIAVEEILEILWHTHKNADEYEYYQQVKTEIEKL